MIDPLRLNQVQQSQPEQAGQTRSNNASQQTTGGSFADQLEEARLKFSNHAQKRLQARSIDLDETSLDRLAEAVDKAEERGGKDSLILMDDLAFIVNVRERTVVTTMDMNRAKENVFTQIDSVVIADRKENGSE